MTGRGCEATGTMTAGPPSRVVGPEDGGGCEDDGPPPRRDQVHAPVRYRRQRSNRRTGHANRRRPDWAREPRHRPVELHQLLGGHKAVRKRTPPPSSLAPSSARQVVAGQRVGGASGSLILAPRPPLLRSGGSLERFQAWPSASMASRDGTRKAGGADTSSSRDDIDSFRRHWRQAGRVSGLKSPVWQSRV